MNMKEMSQQEVENQMNLLIKEKLQLEEDYSQQEQSKNNQLKELEIQLKEVNERERVLRIHLEKVRIQENQTNELKNQIQMNVNILQERYQAAISLAKEKKGLLFDLLSLIY